MSITEDTHPRPRVVVNLATGLEDSERVTVALLVASAAAKGGREVAMFLTKEAVRLATAGYARGIACAGCPPLAELLEQVEALGVRLLACPVCVDARGIAADALRPGAEVAGATPLWAWIGDGATVFSY